MHQLAVFVSGRGSNLKAIYQAIEAGTLEAEIALVVSNKADAKALAFAHEKHIPTEVCSPAHFESENDYAEAMLSALQKHGVHWVVLAGFLKKIPSAVITAFRNRMLNIHPSLLPAFGGPGMYGMHIHRAVFDRGVTVSGVTIHFVSEVYDDGPIIHQECVNIGHCQTPEEIAATVLAVEHDVLPRTIQQVLTHKLVIIGNRVMMES